MKIINRDHYLNQIIAGKGNGLIKIITGIRRCGKSFLLFRLFYKYLIESGVDDAHIIRIAFDDWEMRSLANPEDFMRKIKELMADNEMYYLLLDEVQLLDDFVPVLNSLMRKENLDIYVTGSNSKFLSSDVATEFRGRGDQIHVYPLSFAEYFSAVDTDKETAWGDYSTFGGLPHILFLDSDKKKIEYLNNLNTAVYLRDIVERHKIRNEAELNELVSIMASTIGSPANPQRISNTFLSLKGKKISPHTVTKYLGFLIDSFIIEKSLRYNIKGRKYINSLSKYYFTDIGLRNSIVDFRQQEMSHIMENIIYNELRIRGYNVDVGIVEHRSNDHGKTVRRYYEVDFVANLGNKRLYIQSAFMMPDPEKVRQESKSLNQIEDSFKKIIITKENIKPWRDEHGIIRLGLFDFLLNPDSV